MFYELTHADTQKQCDEHKMKKIKNKNKKFYSLCKVSSEEKY